MHCPAKMDFFPRFSSLCWHYSSLFILTTFPFIGDNNILLLVASRNFHETFALISLTVGSTNFVHVFFDNHDVLNFFFYTIFRTNAKSRSTNTLTFTNRIKFTSYIGTTTWKEKKIEQILVKKYFSKEYRGIIVNRGERDSILFFYKNRFFFS